MAGVCRNFGGSFEGYKKSGIGGLGYLFTFAKVLFEFLTFRRHGDEVLRQSGRGFRVKKVISKRFAQPSILPRACASKVDIIPTALTKTSAAIHTPTQKSLG